MEMAIQGTWQRQREGLPQRQGTEGQEGQRARPRRAEPELFTIQIASKVQATGEAQGGATVYEDPFTPQDAPFKDSALVEQVSNISPLAPCSL